MKNLLVLHLESISRLRLAVFSGAFPNLSRLMRDCRVFDQFYSSATSSLMTIGYFFHANDFEFDAAAQFAGMRPAGNNRNFFALLRERGYRPNVLCLNALQHLRPRLLTGLADELPEVWSTHDFPTLFARFDALTDEAPFAIYFWDLVTHVEHSLAVAPYARGLTDQLRRACGVADDAIGALLATLERKGLLEQTTLVVFGDHGDDFWTHGFAGGFVHATEPRTDVTWVPLAIRDPAFEPGIVERLASTIDLAPTCMALLGFDTPNAFEWSGRSLLAGDCEFVYSQNLTANQPDNTDAGIAQSFAITDATYTLAVSRRGLALYAHRLDPGNHCNLLHFFKLGRNGRLTFESRTGVAEHFRAALQANPAAIEALRASFRRMREALAARVAAKRSYIVTRGVDPVNALDPSCFDTVDRRGRDALFAPDRPAEAVARPAPVFDFSIKVG